MKHLRDPIQLHPKNRITTPKSSQLIDREKRDRQWKRNRTLQRPTPVRVLSTDRGRRLSWCGSLLGAGLAGASLSVRSSVRYWQADMWLEVERQELPATRKLVWTCFLHDKISFNFHTMQPKVRWNDVESNGTKQTIWALHKLTVRFCTKRHIKRSRSQRKRSTSEAHFLFLRSARSPVRP